jgi:hypothetical protein
MGIGGTDKGKLMVTSDLNNWTSYFGKARPYVAEVDMSNVPRNAYRQVQRGFGNEFMVSDPSTAKVAKVMDRKAALAADRRYHSVLGSRINSDESLKAFYNYAHS